MVARLFTQGPIGKNLGSGNGGGNLFAVSLKRLVFNGLKGLLSELKFACDPR
jgi:hypothetical protein